MREKSDSRGRKNGVLGGIKLKPVPECLNSPLPLCLILFLLIYSNIFWLVLRTWEPSLLFALFVGKLEGDFLLCSFFEATPICFIRAGLLGRGWIFWLMSRFWRDAGFNRASFLYFAFNLLFIPLWGSDFAIPTLNIPPSFLKTTTTWDFHLDHSGSWIQLSEASFVDPYIDWQL